MEKNKPETSYEQFKKDLNQIVFLIIVIWFFVAYWEALKSSYREGKWLKFSVLIGAIVVLIGITVLEKVKEPDSIARTFNRR